MKHRVVSMRSEDMRKLLLVALIISSFFPDGWSQRTSTLDSGQLVQLTGRLTDELLQPLPYAHVLVLTNYRGTITDRQGKFSFVTQVGDSIMFSTLGYRRKIIVIPDTLSTPFYTLDLVLDEDTFMIAEVEVYPWKDYEEFKEAFINLKLPDDDIDNARKNIALLKTQIILDETPSARANFQHIFEQQYQQTYTQGNYPTYQIFNAFAWAEFFEALKRGDFSNYSAPGD